MNPSLLEMHRRHQEIRRRMGGGAPVKKVVEPEVIEPEVIEPEVIEPEVIEPEVIEPEKVRTNEPLTMAEIKKTVAAAFGLAAVDLSCECRSSKFLAPRHIAMYFCRELSRRSYPAIGIAFGRRDHSTVVRAIRKIENARTRGGELAETVNAIEKMFGERSR